MRDDINPANLNLTSSNPNTKVFVCIALLLFVAGLYLAMNGKQIGWILGVVCSIAIPTLVFNSVNQSSGLTLARGGFSVKKGGFSTSFKWSDIEAFSISGGRFRKRVTFRLSPGGQKRYSPGQLSLVKRCSGTATDSFELPERYGLSVDRLFSLMSQWHQQSSGGESP